MKRETNLRKSKKMRQPSIGSTAILVNWLKFSQPVNWVNWSRYDVVMSRRKCPL
jgi:hypothetical protein